jgi:hypothetical protein
VPEGHPAGVWYAVVSRRGPEADDWVIRVSSTPDVDRPWRDQHVCRDADEACELLRRWLAETATP